MHGPLNPASRLGRPNHNMLVGDGITEEDEDEDEALSSVIRPSRLFTSNAETMIPYGGPLLSPTGGQVGTGTPESNKSWQRLGGISGTASPAKSIIESVRRRDEFESKLENAKKRALVAESRAEGMSSQLERERVETDKLRDMYQTEIKKQAARIEKLETDRRWLMEQEAAAQKRIQELEGVKPSQGSEYLEQKCNDMEAEKRELMARLEDLEMQHRIKIRQFEDREQALKCQISELTQRCDHYMSQSSTHAQKVKSLQAELLSLERQLMDAQSRTMDHKEPHHQSELGDSKKCDISELLAHIRHIEFQNKRLTDDNALLRRKNSNIALLEEQNMALQAKLDRQERELEAAAESNADYTLLRQEREEWNRVFNEGRGSGAQGATDLPTSPYAALKLIKDLRGRVRDLNAQIDDMQLIINNRTQDGEEVRRAADDLRRRYHELEGQVAKERATNRALDKVKLMAQREVAFLRDQLRLYDAEEMFDLMQATEDAEIGESKAGQADSGLSRSEAQKVQRIAKLERLVDQQRQWLEELEAEVLKGPAEGQRQQQQQDAGGAGEDGYSRSRKALELANIYQEDVDSQQRCSELEARLREMEEQFSELKRENAALNRRYDELESETTRLERLVGEGDYDPRTTRILQLRDNPTSLDLRKRDELLESLKNENKSLLKQLESVQTAMTTSAPPSAASGQGDGNTSITGIGDDLSSQPNSPLFHTINNLKQENRELTEHIETLEKRMSRLRNEWANKAKEVRQVIYSLLGYRLDLLPHGKIRLTSMYAEKIEHCFTFTYSDDNDANNVTQYLTGGSIGGGQGTMVLTGGGSKDFLERNMANIEFWIRDRGSVPAFLATTTVQMFEAWEDRQKRQHQQ
ncbi:coiled-coil domain-containing protein mad1 [Spiromyces aspiralis]|uniref:Coiled-coil domain-containing protein mad1 n=1 Tax=Spiromyces aspiralis TaxID=68401 RepID=A0ACC1HU99_9FUNG|nr:coiled-coil domain-containing protein mad1 [Spiromyces aspiralis]